MVVASEEEFQSWRKLVEEGVPYYQASQQVGTTMRRLRNFALEAGERDLVNEVIDLSREKQSAKVEKRVEELAMVAEPNASIVTAWAKANHPDYADKAQLEITAKVEHEHRGVFAIGDLARVAEELGILEQLEHARSQAALPPAGEVPAGRSAPALDQAGDLPPARSA